VPGTKRFCWIELLEPELDLNEDEREETLEEPRPDGFGVNGGAGVEVTVTSGSLDCNVPQEEQNREPDSIC
jgi:hypothetical protein